MPYFLSKIKYLEISSDSIDDLKSNIILFVTATLTETQVLHTYIEPLTDQSNIIKVYKNNLTYYIGKFGKYKIVHVQSDLGSVSRSGSIPTISEAIGEFKPKLTIMVGVAFGLNSVEQKIGDVLISEAVLPYDYKKVGTKRTIQRATHAPTSKKLLSRFKNNLTWEFLLGNGEKACAFVGHILSGEVLIDNKKYRDKIKSEFPTAIGGEMEGVGLYAACDGNCDWMLIKGICDFADGNKKYNKQNRQKIATHSAVTLCLDIFSNNTIFEAYKIRPVDHGNNNIIIKECKFDALFEVYNKEKESYYVNRKEDVDFNLYLNQFGIWLYGPSGCGKSNIILRNLLFYDKSFVQISLASYTSDKIEEVFYGIYLELKEVLHTNVENSIPLTVNEITKAILGLLNLANDGKELYIFIEEIPIAYDADLKLFSEKFNSLIINKSFIPQLDNIKFILSSIKDPTIIIPVYQQKIQQYIKFKKLGFWYKKDFLRLNEIIKNNLNIDLPNSTIELICKKSNFSPRFLKKYYRNLIAMNDISNTGFENSLIETEKEFTLA